MWPQPMPSHLCYFLLAKSLMQCGALGPSASEQAPLGPAHRRRRGLRSVLLPVCNGKLLHSMASTMNLPGSNSFNSIPSICDECMYEMWTSVMLGSSWWSFNAWIRASVRVSMTCAVPKYFLCVWTVLVHLNHSIFGGRLEFSSPNLLHVPACSLFICRWSLDPNPMWVMIWDFRLLNPNPMPLTSSRGSIHGLSLDPRSLLWLDPWT